MRGRAEISSEQQLVPALAPVQELISELADYSLSLSSRIDQIMAGLSPNGQHYNPNLYSQSDHDTDSSLIAEYSWALDLTVFPWAKQGFDREDLKFAAIDGLHRSEETYDEATEPNFLKHLSETVRSFLADAFSPVPQNSMPSAEAFEDLVAQLRLKTEQAEDTLDNETLLERMGISLGSVEQEEEVPKQPSDSKGKAKKNPPTYYVTKLPPVIPYRPMVFDEEAPKAELSVIEGIVEFADERTSESLVEGQEVLFLPMGSLNLIDSVINKVVAYKPKPLDETRSNQVRPDMRFRAGKPIPLTETQLAEVRAAYDRRRDDLIGLSGDKPDHNLFNDRQLFWLHYILVTGEMPTVAESMDKALNQSPGFVNLSNVEYPEGYIVDIDSSNIIPMNAWAQFSSDPYFIEAWVERSQKMSDHKRQTLRNAIIARKQFQSIEEDLETVFDRRLTA